MKQAVIYCRVDRPVMESTQWALDLQKLRLEDYAAKHHIQIVGVYQDGGYSGHTLDRPGLQALMRDAAAGGFDTVLVANRNRFYRGTSPMPKELKDLPVKVRSLKELENRLER